MYLEKYKIIRKLGNGNMGQVYLGLNEKSGIYYAIKTVFSDDIDYNLKKDALKKEFNVLSSFNDRRIPYVIEFIEEDEFSLFVMEYIDGVDLKNYINDNSPFNNNEIINIMRQIVEIMCCLHSRRPAIIYRDLKPENLIITKEGIIKIIDFGTIARGFGTVSDKISYGTFGYCSKEQLNNQTITTATDIYSIGAIFSYLITGVNPSLPPFKVTKLSNFPDYYNNYIVSIVDKCLEEDPDNRYKNAMDLLKDIDELEINKISRSSINSYIYNIILIFLSFITILGLYFNSIKICIISIICNLISYAISGYFENINYKKSFIKKRCYNILWTEKKYVGLL